jgi:iron complex outermembrane receptor protein
MARAQAVSKFDLPAQPLADSLRAIASQTDTDLLFDPPLVAGRRAPALKADLTVEGALVRLLAGTGIRYEFLNEKTVVLTAGRAVPSPPGAAPAIPQTNRAISTHRESHRLGWRKPRRASPMRPPTNRPLHTKTSRWRKLS